MPSSCIVEYERASDPHLYMYQAINIYSVRTTYLSTATVIKFPTWKFVFLWYRTHVSGDMFTTHLPLRKLLWTGILGTNILFGDKIVILWTFVIIGPLILWSLCFLNSRLWSISISYIYLEYISSWDCFIALIICRYDLRVTIMSNGGTTTVWFKSQT